MAQAALKERDHDHGPLEENGIVRSTIFPNAVRDVRVRRGFDTLRDLDERCDTGLTYTRLGKIERGEVFPTGDEMRSISRALGVGVTALLVDTADPEFDREAWARDHIVASLSHRGGGLDAMRLGAAMRVRRLAMGRSTTDMREPFGLPAATVSRIENAEHPIGRWDGMTQHGIALVMGVRRPSEVEPAVDAMFEAGELDAMLRDLFSPGAIERRNVKRMRALLENLSHDDAKAGQALHRLETVRRLGARSGEDGSFLLGHSTDRTPRPEGAGLASFAIRIPSPVLGPGYPTGTVAVFDPAQAVAEGDEALVVSEDGASARLVSVGRSGDGLVGYSMASDMVVPISTPEPGSSVARLVAVVD